MKRKQDKSKSADSQAGPKRTFGDVAVLIGFFALPALLVFWVAQRSPHPPARTASTAMPANPAANGTQALLTSQAPIPPGATSSLPNSLTANPPAASPTPAISPPPPAALPPRIEPVRDPAQLVASLSDLDLSSGAITPDQVAQWKQSVQKLVQQGAAAVPAIREFLAKNIDIDLDALKGGDSLGYATLRLALFDVLRQIKGPESIDASLQVLKTTADPREIGILARNLEQQAPAQHRPAAVAAAREAIAQADRGQLEGSDVAPLFEILQQFGGADAASQLEQVSQKWNYYSTIALGGLPGGAGVPALIRMAQDASVPNVMALRILAQLAGKYPEARAALINQVKLNKVPYSAWSGLESALSGELMDYASPVLGAAPPALPGPNARTFHISYGNQNFRTVLASADWSTAQIKEQLALIDQVIAVGTTLETLESLQKARLSLAGRVPK